MCTFERAYFTLVILTRLSKHRERISSIASVSTAAAACAVAEATAALSVFTAAALHCFADGDAYCRSLLQTVDLLYRHLSLAH